jgi:hypothetical protein
MLTMVADVCNIRQHESSYCVITSIFSYLYIKSAEETWNRATLLASDTEVLKNKCDKYTHTNAPPPTHPVL